MREQGRLFSFLSVIEFLVTSREEVLRPKEEIAFFSTSEAGDGAPV